MEESTADEKRTVTIRISRKASEGLKEIANLKNKTMISALDDVIDEYMEDVIDRELIEFNNKLINDEEKDKTDKEEKLKWAKAAA